MNMKLFVPSIRFCELNMIYKFALKPVVKVENSINGLKEIRTELFTER